MNWTPAPRYLRDFNGLRKTAPWNGGDVGVFRERYAYLGKRWAVRTRRPGDCWGLPVYFADSLREGTAWANEYCR